MMNRKQKHTLQTALNRFAADFKKFLGEHEYGEFTFGIVLKEGGLVHSYSVSGKTTHGPLHTKHEYDKDHNELKEIVEELEGF
jgi:hypothetical protein